MCALSKGVIGETANMTEHWAALAYVEAERRFRKIQRHHDIWILSGAPSNRLID